MTKRACISAAAAAVEQNRMIAASTTRSRRLRKKLRVEKFRQLGFEVTLVFQQAMAEAEDSAFWDAFIDEAIEPNGLMFGGGENGFVCVAGRASATEEHRQDVESWLRQRPEIKSVSIGPLEDAWHGTTLKT